MNATAAQFNEFLNWYQGPTVVPGILDWVTPDIMYGIVGVFVGILATAGIAGLGTALAR